MNVEASNEAMEELTTTFKFNDAVIRNLVIRKNEPVTNESLIMKAEREDKERKARYQDRQTNESRNMEGNSESVNDDVGNEGSENVLINEQTNED